MKRNFILLTIFAFILSYNDVDKYAYNFHNLLVPKCTELHNLFRINKNFI